MPFSLYAPYNYSPFNTFTTMIDYYDFRKHLEKKFRSYQAILGDRSESCGKGIIDLEEISEDFCVLDDDSRITIRCIPTKDDYVFLTCYDDAGNKTIIRTPLRSVSDNNLEELVEIMRKSMIIEELKCTYNVTSV